MNYQIKDSFMQNCIPGLAPDYIVDKEQAINLCELTYGKQYKNKYGADIASTATEIEKLTFLEHEKLITSIKNGDGGGGVVTIVSASRKTTAVGNNYYDIVVKNELGELCSCVYFGNTKPTKISLIREVATGANEDAHTYFIAVIQPHTSRDKRTGKFKLGWRTE